MDRLRSRGTYLEGLRCAQKHFIEKAGGVFKAMDAGQEKAALDAAIREHLVRRALAASIFEEARDSSKILSHVVANHFSGDTVADDGEVFLRPIYGRVDTDRAMPLIALYDIEDDTLVARFRYAPKGDRLARVG